MPLLLMSGAVVRAVGAFMAAGADPGLFVFDKAPHRQNDREQHDGQHDDRDPIVLQELKHISLSFFIYSCVAQNRGFARRTGEPPARVPHAATVHRTVAAPFLRFLILRVSPAAAGDQRLRLWNPQAFVKA